MVLKKNSLLTKAEPCVVYFVTDYTVANKFGLEQIEYLNKLTKDIHVFCGPGKLDLRLFDLTNSITQFKFLTRNISIFKDFLIFFQLLFKLYRLRPKIIIYSTPKASILGAAAGFISRTPKRINQLWGARWETLFGVRKILVMSLDLASLYFSTHIIGVSKSIQKRYQPFTKKRIDIIGKGSAIGVDPKIFFPKTSKDKDNLTLGYSGRVAGDKGLGVVISVFASVVKLHPAAKLQIIGDLDFSDPISNEVMSELCSNPRISWIRHSERNELARHMREWSVQIFPSEREGLGNSIIEAASCGVPTICWDVTGVRDAVPEFLKYLVVSQGELNEFKQTLFSLLAKPLSEKETTSLVNWAITNFSKDKVLTDWTKYVALAMENR
jgi:glycosyltransferase involved in cell wall biosynthesis